MTSCCVKSCPSWPGSSGVRFYSFPVNRNFPEAQRRNAWLKAIGDRNMNLESAYICSRHFVYGRPAELEESDHPDWVPTLAMSEAVDEEGFDVEGSIKAMVITSIPVEGGIAESSSKMCRLCLGREVKLMEPFQDDTGTNSALLKQIYECTTVKITLKASYPAAICAMCYTKLDEYSKFREKCIENDGILRMMVGDVGDEEKGNDICETGEFKDLQRQLYGWSENQTTVSRSELAATTVVPASTALVPRRTAMIEKNLAATNVRKLVNIKSSITGGHKTGLQFRIGQNGRLYCLICSQSFGSRCALRRHMKMHIEGMSTCEYCGKKFKYHPHLKMHLRVHTGDKLVRCAVCFKTFVCQSSLRCHLRSHLKLKVFECRLCAEIAETYEELATHVKTKHDQVQLKAPTNNSTDDSTRAPTSTTPGSPGEKVLDNVPVQIKQEPPDSSCCNPTQASHSPHAVQQHSLCILTK